MHGSQHSIGPRPRPRRPTIRDVAHDAGISKTSVSRYFGDERELLSADMQTRIETAIARLGFKPDRMAASLRGGRTGLIGALVADIRNPYSVALIHAAETACQAAGYTLVVCNTNSDDALERRHLDVLDGYSVEGLMVNTPGQNLDALAQRLDAGLPLVLVDRYFAGLDCDRIGLDNEQAMAIALDHLCEQGFERLVMISEPATGISTRTDRIAAFERGCARRGVAERVHEQPLDAAYQSQLQRALAEEGGPDRPPTALVCANGVVTLAVCRALYAAGTDPFTRVGVLGIDELDWCALVGPGITTVAQPVDAIGSFAVQRLIDHIRQPAQPSSARDFPARLKIRGSTRGQA